MKESRSSASGGAEKISFVETLDSPRQCATEPKRELIASVDGHIVSDQNLYQARK